MDEHPLSSSLRVLMKNATRGACITAIVIGVSVLLGWTLDNDTLKRIVPGLVAMNPLTALGFMLSGAALWLLQDEPDKIHPGTRRVAQTLGAIVLLIGLVKLVEIATHHPIGMDRWLFRDKLDLEAAAGLPNRMAPNTAFSFLLVGLALVLLDVRWRRRLWPAQLIAVVGSATSLLALVGYAYGTKSFYGVSSFIPMALHTALTFLLLMAALLFARPQRGAMLPINSDSAGGSMARLLLPAAIVMPFLLGWLSVVLSEHANVLSTINSLSLFVVLNMLVFAVLVWWNASELYHTDRARQKTARQLERSHAELSRRNAEMEADLNLAREIQLAFLPQQYLSFPRLVGPLQGALQFHHRYRPASTLGGDFTDILILSETRAGIFICDVMGHGVRSALVTAVARGLIEELIPSAVEPGKFLTQLNHSLMTILQRTRTPMFASAFFMIADAETGMMHFSNAGHPSPLHLRRTLGVVEPLAKAADGAGPALGIMENYEYSGHQRTLDEGDLIMLFTDGLVEVSRGKEEYGEDRLIEAVRRRLDMPAPPLFDELLSEIQHFSDSRLFEDDVCLAGMEVTRLTSQRAGGVLPA